MVYTADDVPFLTLLAKSADRALADGASSTLAGMVLKFDPEELRDDHGRWSAVGAAVHALEHVAEVAAHHDSPPPERGRDNLKLAGKIHLDPGERLVGSGKVADEDGSVRLAATEKDGQQLLRFGVGNWAFGKPNKSEGTVAWTGGPDRFDEAQDAADKAAEEHERLEQQWDDTPTGPERDAIERRLDELDESGATSEVIGGGHTMRLDPPAVQQLRDTLTEAHLRAVTESDRVNGLWDEFEGADARLDEMDGWPTDHQWSQAEKDEYQAVLHRRWDLADRLGLDQDGNADTSMTTFAEGVIPGEWGDLHYDAYLDEPSEGPRLELAVVPHGKTMDDVRQEEATYILNVDQWRQLLKQVDTLTPTAGKLAAADLGKWTYNPQQSRVGGRFASGTGSNITSGGDVVVSGRQGTSVVPVRPLNAAAARASSGKPANGAAARLTPQVRRPPAPPQKQATKPKPKPKPTTAKPPPAKPGPEAATRSPHTAIGSQDGDRLTVSHRSTTQTRQAEARERGREAATRARERAELNAVRTSLATAKAKASASKATTKQRDAAVDAMKDKYGIPSSLRHVSKDRQQAASDMGSATRKMVTDRARIATAQAQVAAVRAQYKKGQSAATTAYLNGQLAKAQARVNAANTSLSQAQTQFNAAAKKWKH